MTQKYPVILASKSPRRKELLEKIGITFTVMDVNASEETAELDPREVPAELSKRKANAAFSAWIAKGGSPDVVVIGSDTIVYADGRIFGKPKDEEVCAKMIRTLSGNTHQVYTGVTMLIPAESEEEKPQEITFTACTDVTVAPMSEAEILAYCSTKEPYDKAGGYGIQGEFCKYISEICGDYYNVVGLPVPSLYKKMLEYGLLFV